jgi:RES domain-containing protein
MAARRARDSRLLDAVEALPVTRFDGSAWRIVRDGRDPLQASAVGGRWDDRTFEVLYTSTTAEGAMAEMYFHLSRGQPVMPSRVQYRMFELAVTLSDCMKIATLGDLAALGVSIDVFGRLSYSDREREYPRTQDVGEAAHFHERAGMLVPSARSDSANLVIISEWAGPTSVSVVQDHGLIDWGAWRRRGE